MYSYFSLIYDFLLRFFRIYKRLSLELIYVEKLTIILVITKPVKQLKSLGTTKEKIIQATCARAM